MEVAIKKKGTSFIAITLSMQICVNTGKLPDQTRSRLLIEAKKDSTMYTWLGFTSQADLMKALKENPSRIKQIPAALLTMIEEEAEGMRDKLYLNLLHS